MRHQLPTSNPECVHDWHASPTTHVWECTRCGYVVSETELHEPTEGMTFKGHPLVWDHEQPPRLGSFARSGNGWYWKLSR